MNALSRTNEKLDNNSILVILFEQFSHLLLLKTAFPHSAPEEMHTPARLRFYFIQNSFGNCI